MKRLAVILMLVLMALPVQRAAAGDLFETIKEQALDSLRAYATPLVQVFGTAVGGGLYHTASTHGTLGFDVGVQAMSVLVPQGESRILDSAEVEIVPLPVVQANLGLPLGLGLMVRGTGYKYQDETLALYGAGLKKDFKDMIPIPQFPHVGAMVAYHQFKGGDILEANVLSFDVMASKGFLMVEPYIGYGYDRTSMEFKYTYTVGGSMQDTIDEKFTESTSRLTLGVKMTPFPFVNVFADYNISKFNSFTAGLALSFR